MKLWSHRGREVQLNHPQLVSNFVNFWIFLSSYLIARLLHCSKAVLKEEISHDPTTIYHLQRGVNSIKHSLPYQQTVLQSYHWSSHFISTHQSDNPIISFHSLTYQNKPIFQFYSHPHPNLINFHFNVCPSNK